MSEYKLPGSRFLDVHWKGWISIVGSFMVYVLIGYVYLWGFIGEIVISYFHYQGDHECVESDASSMIPNGLLVMAFLNPLGPTFFRFFNIKIIVLMGVGIMTASLAIAINTSTKFYVFEIWWVFCMSLGMALCYTSLQMSAW